MYAAVWNQLRMELGHVSNIIGGYDSEPKVGAAPGVRFTPVPEARQKAAVKFIGDNLFKSPAWLMPADILRKLEPSSGQERLLSLQKGILGSMLNAARVERLQEHEAILGSKAYTVAEMLLDMRSGIFGELAQAQVRVDPYRRNLQRAYVTMLGDKINPPEPSRKGMSDDSRGAIRAELKALRTQLREKGAVAADTATGNHLADLADQIDRILDPRAGAR